MVITGAAAGIGRAAALKLSAAGYRVVALDVDETGLGALAAEASAASGEHGEIDVATLDVTDADQWATTLADLLPDGRLDVLVNNAGVLSSGPFEEITVEAHRRIIDINVLGTINGCHAAFPYLRDTAGAQVVNLCSASAIYGQPELASYSASKFAVRGLTEALDLEWSAHDIRVVAVWPLFVATDMVQGMDIGSTRALGVNLTPDDVADAILKTVRRRRGVVPKVHYPVGIPAKVFAALADVSPGWVNRTLNKRLTH